MILGERAVSRCPAHENCCEALTEGRMERIEITWSAVSAAWIMFFSAVKSCGCAIL